MPTTLRLLAFVPLCVALHAVAQALPVPAEAADPVPRGPRIERIQHEDALARIDELRVGGQTRSIDVSPKNGAPAYQIAPQSSGAMPSDSQGQRTGTAGKSSWRVLSF
jgi:hypothetical protein